MAMKKVTLTLDDETLAKLEQTAARVHRPKSEIVREAINNYAPRAPEVTEEEIQRRVKAYEEFLKTPPEKTRAEVEAELEEIRRSRRHGWQRGFD